MDNKKFEIIQINRPDIDLEMVEKLRNNVDEIIKSGVVNIFVDLSPVNYLSSTGLGLLVHANNICKLEGGKFGIFGLQEYTLDMLKMTKLDSVLHVYKTKEEAINALNEI